MNEPKFKLDWLILPFIGVVCVLLLWTLSSATWAKELPSPTQTWAKSKDYILNPFQKRGEMDQGILRFTWYSLILVAKGYALALIVGTPVGFFLGLSKTFTKTFDPIIQVLRPVSPLAWLPLGLVLFLSAGKQASELGALFTIAVCAMWPTVLNTAVGVRAIPQDYLNVAKVLKLSRAKTPFQSSDPGHAAIHVHRVPTEPRNRVAGDRRGRNVNRPARCRRLSLAGI
jgi:nitrate/nitrite transport system permease protein